MAVTRAEVARGFTNISAPSYRQGGNGGLNARPVDAFRLAVLALPSATAASAFYAASSGRWSACSNRQFDANDPDDILSDELGTL